MKREERALAGLAAAIVLSGGLWASVPAADVRFDELGRPVATPADGRLIADGDPPSGPPNTNCPCGWVA